MKDASGRTAEQFLDEMFEFEYCSECGRDKDEHDPVIFNRLWFARCRFEEPEPAGSRDRDEWKHEAAQQMRLK